MFYLFFSCFFFFQAEDGIRDGHVTGVQTCALPICRIRISSSTIAILVMSVALSWSFKSTQSDIEICSIYSTNRLLVIRLVQNQKLSQQVQECSVKLLYYFSIYRFSNSFSRSEQLLKIC